jgi:asparagine synthase (glutamine-hydrolysing)
MCGIAGYVVKDTCLAAPPRLFAAANLLAKRGPDDEGVWNEGAVGLAHRRLSVLDISPSGHQPMFSDDERYVIVFNGEIYNYQELRAQLTGQKGRWRSSGDTEVILEAYIRWGAACVAKLHGMFAFAIWDRSAHTLFLARDRLGVKPLYYAQANGAFAFASRPRALNVLIDGLDSEVDLEGLRAYLDIGYFPGEHSLFQKIRRCPPGHYLWLDNAGLTTHRYWNPAAIEPEMSWQARSEDDLLDELDALVKNSVKLRMVSDVPLGAFLSGGIDSSLVVAMMRQLSSGEVETFTIGFEEPEFDESAHAIAVATYLGVRNHVEKLSVDDLLQLMPAFSQEYDEPFFDSSAFPSMALSRLARRHVTVSLSGDGGDELFGGYHYYQIVGKLRPFYQLPSSLRWLVASVIGYLPGHRNSLLSSALKQRDITDVFGFIRSIAKNFPSVLTGDAMASTRGIRGLFRDECSGQLTGLLPEEKAMRLDLMYTLPDEYLQKLDVASMAFSLEARDPLLDHELAEWALRLPLCWKIRNGQNKYLLRKLAYRYVPQPLLDRPKKGFEVPIAKWLRGPLKVWALERLTDRSAFERLPLDPVVVRQLFDLHCSGKRDAHPILWAVLMLIDFMSVSRRHSA